MAEQESEKRASTQTVSGPASEQWLEETLDKVFLTPRVLDEVAFDDLSTSLKSLVKDAGAQSRALIANTGEVKLLGDQLREATRELQGRVESAAKVIPTLDQRVAKAEQLLDLTGRELALKVSEFRDFASRGVNIDLERIEAQVRAEATGIIEQILKEQVAGLRERIEAAVQEAEFEARRRGEEIIERIRLAQQSLDEKLAASENKATAIAQQLDHLVVQELEPALARARAAGGEIDAATTRAHDAGRTLETAVQDAGVRLGAAISEADRRAETIGNQAAKRIGDLRQKAIEVVEVASAARAEDILAVVQDTVAAAQRSEAAAKELRELVAQAEQLRGFSGSLDSAGVQVELLTGRLGKLREDYEALTSSADSGLEAKVRQMGAWLTQLLTQGDQIGRGLDRLIRQAGPSLPGST